MLCKNWTLKETSNNNVLAVHIIYLFIFIYFVYLFILWNFNFNFKILSFITWWTYAQWCKNFENFTIYELLICFLILSNHLSYDVHSDETPYCWIYFNTFPNPSNGLNILSTRYTKWARNKLYVQTFSGKRAWFIHWFKHFT